MKHDKQNSDIKSTNNVFEFMAPLSGLVVPLDKVPDSVFAQKIMGPGVAIDPTTTQLLAPCAGRLVQLHPSRHALTIQTESGLQVLLHIGIDTVALKGEGFTARVQSGAPVEAGQVLIEFDADLIAGKVKSLLTVMVITEPIDSSVQVLRTGIVSAGSDKLLSVEVKSSATSAKRTHRLADSLESKPIEIQLASGLHARPAALLAQLAKSFQSDVQIRRGTASVNSKSLVGILSLEVGFRDQVIVMAKGADAKEAITQMTQFLSQLTEVHEDSPTPKPKATQPTARAHGQALRGTGISPGVAVGQLQQVKVEEIRPTESSSQSPTDEKANLHRALEKARVELERLGRTAGPAGASIFAAHQELLRDPELLNATYQQIQAGKTAGFAWQLTVNLQSTQLANLKNELLAHRAVDLRDVGLRVLRLLVPSTHAPVLHAKYAQTILLAANLTPSETMQLDRTRVFGFCTTAGGSTSHVAILARSLGIPAVAGIDADAFALADGTQIVLDGDAGEIRLKPSASELQAISDQQTRLLEQRRIEQQAAHSPAVTRDGKHIKVFSNIGRAADARTAVELGADGVGLLRTEFLFLERESAPTEDEQLAVYQEIADVLGKRPLTIRTLDVGGDKPLSYMPLADEENPFLGVRGIRFSLKYEEQFRQQLRAILRVRSQGQIKIMFPMITTLAEFRKAKGILEEERMRLGAPPALVGIMVEVPAVALMAEEFAKEVDFFSVGTNDLVQYTLAMDRGNPALSTELQGIHTSVLRLMEMTVQAARKFNRPVGVCGGWASEADGVPKLLQIGIEELSASMHSVPQVKAQVRTLSINDASLDVRTQMENHPHVR